MIPNTDKINFRNNSKVSERLVQIYSRKNTESIRAKILFVFDIQSVKLLAIKGKMFSK